jgi:D-alanyl-D-alanine carboxypeptidase
VHSRGGRAPTLAATLVAVALAITACGTDAAPRPTASAEASAELSVSPTPSPPAPEPTPAFDRSAFSIDEASSPWVVVDKLRPLNPIDYVPELVDAPVPFISNPQMRPEAAEAMARMFAAAAAEGAGSMQIQNAYRSFATQTSVHERLVASLGQAKARAQSAQPGYSEHQTGLAADITALPEECSIQACFGQTPQGLWLAANSWRFGFILRYPADKTPITGYIYEPWHFRYVGVELSTEMHSTGVTTLEEFFALPAAPDYAG